MEFTEKTLILKVGRFREADCWVRLFSPNQGVMTAFAFGGSRSRRRFCGCLDSLNQVVFRIKPNRAGTYYCLEEGALVNGFSGIKNDSLRLGMAVNCVKFMEAVQIGPEGADAAYSLLLSVLDLLEGGFAATDMLPLFFRARVTFDQGYAPQIDRCHGCGRPLSQIDGPLVLLRKGRLSCRACRPRFEPGLPVSPDSARMLDRVAKLFPSEWDNGETDPKVKSECYRLIEGFVEYHLGLTWKQGGFRRV